MNITIVFLSHKFIYSQPNIKLFKNDESRNSK